MSWLHRIPIIGGLLDFGGDISYEVKRARLEKLDRDEPIELVDQVLGTFRYRRELNWFETKRKWSGLEIDVTLDGDWTRPEDVPDDAADMLMALRTFWEDQAGWLEKCKACIERDLLELAKEWSADAGKPLTKEQFLSRIKPQSIGTTAGIYFDIWFEDDDVFAGHGILVSGRIKDGPEKAQIHG